MISIFMVLGVLLITRPPAIFGQDEARRKAGTNETSTFHNMSSDRNNFDHHFMSDAVFIKEQNATLYKVPSMRGPYNSPIPLSGTFHPKFQELLRNSEKINEDDFKQVLLSSIGDSIKGILEEEGEFFCLMTSLKLITFLFGKNV